MPDSPSSSSSASSPSISIEKNGPSTGEAEAAKLVHVTPGERQGHVKTPKLKSSSRTPSRRPSDCPLRPTRTKTPGNETDCRNDFNGVTFLDPESVSAFDYSECASCCIHGP